MTTETTVTTGKTEATAQGVIKEVKDSYGSNFKRRMQRAVWVITGLVIGASMTYKTVAEAEGRYTGELTMDQCRFVAEGFLKEFKSVKDKYTYYGIKGDEIITLVSISDLNNCFFLTESPSTNEVRPWSTSYDKKGRMKYFYEHQTFSEHYSVNGKDRVFLDLRKVR